MRAILVCLLAAACGPDPSVDYESGGEEELARSRSISEFVAAQGTFCFPGTGDGCLLYAPPVANFLAFRQPDPELCTMVDYAGLADRYLREASGGAISLGTTTSGSVTERTLADGRAEVRVRLRSRQALTWVSEGCDLASDPIVFGHRAADVLAGASAAVGDSELVLAYEDVAPGRPLVDLVQLVGFPLVGQRMLSMTFSAQAVGQLEDGSAGRAQILDVSLTTAALGGAVADGVPVVRIDLIATGP